MMRLWRISWRVSKLISCLAVLAIGGIGVFVGFIIGKQLGTTNNIINVPAPTSRASPAARDEPRRSDDISTLSDDELLTYTIKFTASLRIFESNAMIAVQQFNLSNSPSNFEQNQRSEQVARTREGTEFRNIYLQPAQQLRDEIMRRLRHKGVFIEVTKEFSSFPGSPKVPVQAFDGLLSGPTPIADMADFLESAARKLANDEK